MLALSYVYHLLHSFRYLFTRHATWVTFGLVVLGLRGSHHPDGVSAVCRFWQLGEPDSQHLLHFFPSSAWSLTARVAHWSQLGVSQEVAVTVAGRVVLVGDHTYVVKEARCMPGVGPLHQDSHTQSKPSYFRGHHWGVLGLVVGSLAQAFCLPLDARLHQGFAHLRQEEPAAAETDTLWSRLLAMALPFARRQACPAILVLDAFFATGPVFTWAASLWSIAGKQPYLHIVTRAKKNYVAYHELEPPPPHPQGRPRKYGEKGKLPEVFETPHAQFCTATAQVSGRVETSSYLVLNLLWKPCRGPLRFVFAVTRRGPIVLRCRELSLDPLTALSLYGARVRGETLFAMLKGVIGAFR